MSVVIQLPEVVLGRSSWTPRLQIAVNFGKRDSALTLLPEPGRRNQYASQNGVVEGLLRDVRQCELVRQIQHFVWIDWLASPKHGLGICSVNSPRCARSSRLRAAGTL